jgi:hypothetical protein
LAALPTTAPGLDSEPADSRLIFPQGRGVSFGEVYQHTVVVGRLVFENRGRVPVRILGATAVLAGGRIAFEPEVVPPGGRGEVWVEQPVGDRLGEVTFRFGLKTNDPALPEPKLTLTGFVQSAYDPEVGRIELGQIDRGQGATARFELVTREADRLGNVTMVEGPRWVRLTARGERDSGQGVELEVAIEPNAPLGFHVERLLLRTDVPQQPDYVLELRTSISGDVVASEAPIDLGVLRHHQPFVKEITLRSRSGLPVAIAAVDSGFLEVAESACPGPSDPACRRLSLTGTPQDLGSLVGVLQVHLVGDPEPLPLRYAGVVAPRDTVVRDLGLLAEGTVVHSDGRIERGGGQAASRPPPSESEPVGAPVQEASTEAPDVAVAGATLTWSVREPRRAYGFLIYRAEQREGPYRRVNPEIVRTPHEEDGGVGRYRWSDPEVEPGKTYYYYLDAVTKSGQKQRLTGVRAKTVPELGTDGADAGVDPASVEP